MSLHEQWNLAIIVTVVFMASGIPIMGRRLFSRDNLIIACVVFLGAFAFMHAMPAWRVAEENPVAASEPPAVAAPVKQAVAPKQPTDRDVEILPSDALDAIRMWGGAATCVGKYSADGDLIVLACVAPPRTAI